MRRIAIHSAPRSGSSWLGNIFNSHPNVAFRLGPLFSYAFKGALKEYSSKEEIINFFEAIQDSSDEYMNQEAGIKNGIRPKFRKEDITHICYKEVRYHHLLNNLLTSDNELMVVGIIRNPLAVINSWLNAPKEFKKELGWKVADEWRYAPSKNSNKKEEFNGFEKWKEVTTIFFELQNKHPKRFYLIEYKNLLENPLLETEKLFDFSGLAMNKQTEEFLNQSTHTHKDDAYSVFKKKTKDDAWKNSLPKYIQEEIIADPEVKQWNKKLNWF